MGATLTAGAGTDRKAVVVTPTAAELAIVVALGSVIIDCGVAGERNGAIAHPGKVPVQAGFHVTPHGRVERAGSRPRIRRMHWRGRLHGRMAHGAIGQADSGLLVRLAAVANPWSCFFRS